MSAQTPEICWQPSDEDLASATLSAFTRYVSTQIGRSIDDYGALWRYSTEDLAGFWGAIADYFDVRWHDEPSTVLSGDAMPGARWFAGGTLNYAEHALRTGHGRGDDDIAVIETDESGAEREVTLGKLRAMVGAAQAGLVRLGVGRGDRVVGLVPNRLEALIAFLATASLGAVWSSCSPDFGASSVIDRFSQISPTALIAVDGYRYGGKEFAISDTVSELRAAIGDLAGTVHIPLLGTATPDGAVCWDDFTAVGGDPTFTPVEFSEPLWVLYSSGTTGLPKPIVQSVGGILLEHIKTLALHHDLRPGRRFFWFTTTGWMMWNLLVGGLLVGSAIVIYDGSPARPDISALWRLAARHRIDYVGVSAAFISSCRAAGLAPAREMDLSCVRVVGSTGSPLSTDGFDWIMTNIGPRVQISSLSGGTDVCTAIVGGAPTVPVWRGEISTRALGAAVDAYDEAGRSVRNHVGELVITEPMPSMPVRFWGDDDGSRMHDAYFGVYPGVWRHGDWARITDRGSVVIEGRSDATLNRGGIRMGTAEFYRITDNVPGVADSLVVDTSTAAGEGDLLLFVVLEAGASIDEVTAQLRQTIRAELSPRHVPGVIAAVPTIPRTLNGKKCEVPVKRILAGADVASAISRDALADPGGFDAFLSAARLADDA